jgi:hypothetical protein
LPLKAPVLLLGFLRIFYSSTLVIYALLPVLTIHFSKITENDLAMKLQIKRECKSLFSLALYSCGLPLFLIITSYMAAATHSGGGE